MEKLYPGWALGLLLVISATALSAQDLHYSQFGNSPMNLNPALTGVFRGDQRASVNYRNQWRTVPVDYLQLTGSYDLNFWKNENGEHRPTPFGAGIIFNYDQAGDSKLHLAQLGIAGSYLIDLTRGHGISLGAMLSGAERGFSTTDLRFPSQFDGINYNAQLPINETFDETSYVFGDVGLGANYNYQAPVKRTTINFGGGLYHLFEPQTNYYDADEHRLPRRFSLSATGAIQLASRFDLLLMGVSQWQGDYREVVLGAGGRIHLKEDIADLTDELAIDFGIMTRQNDTGNHFPDVDGTWRQDAIVPFLGLVWERWRGRFSYDINTSRFNVATDRRGGPELSLQYIITNIRPGYCPTCLPTL